MSFSQAYGTSDIDQLAFDPMPEQNDGWQGVTNLEGDYYRELDNVVRGATMSPAEVPCLSSFNGPVDGDFYREPGDAAKGTGLGCGQWVDLGYSQALAPAPPPLAGNSRLCKVAARFADADCPPEVPEDPFFTLEKTTLHVTSGRPFEIGNHMLDFLNTQMTASITKVSHKSVAVKADVFVESRMCTVKLRVYRGPQGTHMVEFQRRDGDAVAFGAVFRQAAQYLGARVQVAGDPPQVAPHALQRSPAGIDVGEPLKEAKAEATLTPILDLAGPTSSPTLQAEAAAMLAETVNKPDAARALFADETCMEAACVSLKALLECDRTDVAYPTARTLRSMAMWPQSEDCFTTHGLLKTMIDKVHSRSCCSLALRELAQAVAAATPHCVGRLSHEAIQEASLSLGEALQGTEDDIVHQSLQQALLALR